LAKRFCERTWAVEQRGADLVPWDCYCIQYNCVGVFVCHHVFANMCASALGALQPNLAGDAETGTGG